VNGTAFVNVLSNLTLGIAMLPSAFFVGRAVWWHLIQNWHLSLGGIGLVPAVLAAAMIELVGILSAHVALAVVRWNRKGQVRKEKSHWERAPVALAVACFSVYCLCAVALTVVLEAYPEFATVAPALFTIMAAVAYLTVGVYEQHRDRLAYYGLAWDWKPVPHEGEESLSVAIPDVRDTAPNVPDADGTGLELDTLDRDILRTLRTEPSASYRTVAEATGSAKTTVAGRTERLLQAGLVSRTGEGWSVRWPDNGS
jgi:hypothetical protein